jgi:4-hydroxy-tetrahydrodipicolinate reductase
MARKYRVVQWATGVVGSAALRSIVRHPRLDLVGVKVYSDDKSGRDAGDIAGIGETGVIATQDVEAIMALDADCVVYCPLPWNLGEICRLLESGKHVVTPCPYWFPFIQSPEVAASLGAACRKGQVNFHASGCNPGGIAERFPLTFTGWCNRIDRITMTECGDCRTYSSEGVMRDLMNLGKTPEEASNNPFKEMLARSWYEPIDMIAEGLGSEVVSYEAKHDFILANQPIQTAVGIIEEGTIALNHYRHIGRTREGTEITQEQIWYVDDIRQTRLQSKMEIPRESGWRIKLEGDVNLHIDIDFPPELTQDERVAQGLSTTAFHLVNAVPLVCEAGDPGLKTFLDLPMITGCMGTHATARP